MGAHAPLPPSSAARFVVCPGSRAMMEAYPQEPTIESAEGDAMHWAQAQLLSGQDIALGQVADNGVTLSEEMIEAAETCADYIKSRPVGVGQVEQMCGSGALHPLNYGTPDHWAFDPYTMHLHVDDSKFGYGSVSEFRNWQLIDYVALIAHERGLFQYPQTKVTMTILQPRAFHRRGPIRSVTTTLGEMFADFQTLRTALYAAMEPNAPVIAADPDQCKDCSGRHNCEAAIMAGHLARDVAYSSTPLIMSPGALSKEYRMLKRAEKMIKLRREGIEQAVLSSIQRGASVPYFSVAHKPGRTIWLAEATQNGLIDVAQAMGVTVQKSALITPLQAIKAGIPADVVKMYSHTPGGGAELVEDDGTLAANIFKGQ